MAFDMLSIDQLRNIDPELRDLSDQDITDIRTRLYALAELALDCWVEQVREKTPAVPQADSHDQNEPHGTLSS